MCDGVCSGTVWYTRPHHHHPMMAHTLQENLGDLHAEVKVKSLHPETVRYFPFTVGCRS